MEIWGGKNREELSGIWRVEKRPTTVASSLTDDDDLIFEPDEMDFEQHEEDMHHLSIHERPENPMSHTLQTQSTFGLVGTESGHSQRSGQHPHSPLIGCSNSSSFMTTPETPFSTKSVQSALSDEGFYFGNRRLDSKATEEDENDADIELDEDGMDEDCSVRSGSGRKRIRSSGQPIPYNPWCSDLNRGPVYNDNGSRYKDRREDRRQAEMKGGIFSCEANNDLASSSDAHCEGSFNSSVSSYTSILTRSINNKLVLDSHGPSGATEDYSLQTKIHY